MGNGSVSELCYRIDGFDVHIDPFGKMGCFNIQDKVIIGSMGKYEETQINAWQQFIMLYFIPIGF